MFAGYNVDLTNAQLDKYLETGRKSSITQKETLAKSLSDYFSDGILNGTKMEADWFPTIGKPDIFISYSHNDEDVALSFAGFLEQELHLNVFVDANIWGSADELLRKIDDEYAKSKTVPNNYNYEDRNFTTSHVHMMLSNAIMKVMDASECIFLLNTDESLPSIAETMGTACTFSPWIYTEIMFTQMLRHKKLSDYRPELTKKGMEFEAREKSLKIKYDVSLDNLIKLNWDDLQAWNTSFKGSRPYGDLLGKTYSLDILYDLK